MIRAALAGLLALVVGACTASESPSAPATKPEPEPAADPEPEARPDSEPPKTIVEAEPEAGPVKAGDYSPAIGGTLPKQASAPGRYASEFRYSQNKFITMEHTIDALLEGTMVLQLHPDGGAELCLVNRDYSSSHRSHYATRSGKDERNESDHRRALAMAGSWTVAKGAAPEIELSFDRMAWNTCEVPASAQTSPEPFSRARCFTTAANDALPRAALICELGEDESMLLDPALLLADHPRVGSWRLRFDPSARGRAEIPEQLRPQLVFGTGEGLRIVSEDGRRDEHELRFEAKKVADPKPPPPPE